MNETVNMIRLIYKLYTMKLVIKLILITIAVLMFNSCCKEKHCANFTASEKEWMSYKNYDTLKFINELNDSVIILGTRSYIEEQKDYHEPETFASCIDGCMNIIRINIHTITCPFGDHFDFYIEKTRIDDQSDSFFVGIGNSYGSGVLSDTINKFDLFALRYSLHHDTITISNILIDDVYEYSVQYEGSRFKKMYVKKGQGLIKFVLYDNQAYSLEDINN